VKLATPRWRIPLVLSGVLLLAGLLAPTALGATKFRLEIVSQPVDTKVDALIRSGDDLDQSSEVFVQVQLFDGSTPVTTKGVIIGFKLATGTDPATGQDFATGKLNVIPQETDANGIATFGLTSTGQPTLSIGTKNEPQFTDYALEPVTTKGAFITGPASQGFDIWEDGEACGGGSDTCEAFNRNRNETYTFAGPGSLGASMLTGVLPGLQCPKQKLIFRNAVFSYATTESPDQPVFLSSHITREDWRASRNEGQAHADWCVGLPSPAAWDKNGANYTQRDTDGDGTLDLFVALAPKCPPGTPAAFAPCIVSQNPDGDGGSTVIGWLPGGDPVRRT
jgi:hypothetical protein